MPSTMCYGTSELFFDAVSMGKIELNMLWRMCYYTSKACFCVVEFCVLNK
jgi:hypothetical protein